MGRFRLELFDRNRHGVREIYRSQSAPMAMGSLHAVATGPDKGEWHPTARTKHIGLIPAFSSAAAHRPPVLTDRLWLRRLTVEGEHPNQLNAILYEDRAELTRAPIAEDNRLIAVIENCDDAVLANLHSYKTTSGMP
jgi:hypothetical protein